MEQINLDRFDLRIIDALQQDGRISITELAAKVGLSKTPCFMRMKKMQKSGIIIGFTALIDPSKMDRNHVAFTEVKLHDTTEQALHTFNTAVRQISEVEQCHMIAGAFDYLLKVRTKDIHSYRRVLGESISALPQVAHTSTYVCMESVVDRAP